MASGTNPDAPQHLLFQYKYHVLIGAYLAATSFFFYRVYRQPFSAMIKSEQYETIFKGTTLVTVVGGVAMSSAGRVRYRRHREYTDSQITQEHKAN